MLCYVAIGAVQLLVSKFRCAHRGVESLARRKNAKCTDKPIVANQNFTDNCTEYISSISAPRQTKTKCTAVTCLVASAVVRSSCHSAGHTLCEVGTCLLLEVIIIVLCVGQEKAPQKPAAK